MPEPNNQREKWLIAVWPGMGNVAVGAGAYLLTKLKARMIHELPASDFFDLQHIEVKHGVAVAGRLPRNMFFEWRNPQGKRDLLIFLGEAQPPLHGYALCHKLLEFAAQKNIKRVFTFAAMATQLHPSNEPRVFGVSSDKAAIDELRSVEVTILKEGQISGMNGILVAAAAERGLPGTCLLGELPYFAAGVPNPKASKAVLEVFCTMAGIELDFEELEKQAETVEQGLLELLEKMQEAARQQGEAAEATFGPPEATGEAETEEEKPAANNRRGEPKLDYATRAKIEKLFDAARQDRSRSVQLKQELDRLGVFRQYEDRFLDLFKKGE
jgi:hypothetical protein